MSEWQKIETAPKHLDVWLFNKHESPQQFVGCWETREIYDGHICKYRTISGWWSYGEDDKMWQSPDVTHWMPLPEPPEEIE